MVSGFRKVHQEKWFRIRASCESMSTCKKKKPNHRTFWQFRSPTLRPKPRNFVKVGVICKPQTNTRDVILGAACMSLGPVTPNVHIFKICQDAPKKKRCEFQTPEPQTFFFCAASPRMRNMQPQTGTFNRN